MNSSNNSRMIVVFLWKMRVIMEGKSLIKELKLVVIGIIIITIVISLREIRLVIYRRVHIY